ncbi:Additional substrate-specific component CbiN of cobalt ECF transporter [Methanosarcina barkeri str. Wiesmoor]|uniref:Cobalt transport protein CbiN n=2 Tax=Methanosarcina barkeri TaxID=2208 RepID=A0A0E3QR38_METBA|nr:energy-coupling factor ABC transporter substrate-binding protein [Methanosarcina barkeri]AKB52760.1 Additional substrate-specific component CbiN of cobalt ECF transporter [Methanosarcina barkeri str. Wiesmoor]
MGKLEIAVLVILVLFIVQFLYVSIFTHAEYGGSDEQGGKKVKEITGGKYEPWIKPIWEPPSGEIETLLFVVQASIGAIIIGYFIGYYRGKEKGRTEARQNDLKHK